MQFQLISANGVKFDSEAYEVLVPTQGGTIALFAGHMPLISAGTPGVLSVRKKSSDSDDQMLRFAVYGGVVQVDGKTARFITDDVTEPHEVSEAESQKALERAESLVSNAGTREELHEARRVQAHHEARLHLAQLKSRHHR